MYCCLTNKSAKTGTLSVFAMRLANADSCLDNFQIQIYTRINKIVVGKPMPFIRHFRTDDVIKNVNYLIISYLFLYEQFITGMSPFCLNNCKIYTLFDSIAAVPIDLVQSGRVGITFN
jgi:hypothetical protein